LEKGQTGARIVLTAVIKKTLVSGARRASEFSSLVAEVAGRPLKMRASSGEERSSLPRL
jgi:hypothetical protein